MFNYEFETNEYYDFVLTDDCRSFIRNIEDSKLFHIDVTQNLCDIFGRYTQNTNVTLENITLNGYDNYFIPSEFSIENTIIDPNVEYIFNEGDKFCMHSVSGYTKNLNYCILTNESFNKLNGGFYQGFYKIQGKDIEFFKSRMKKGWTVNMMLRFPIQKLSSGSTSGLTSGLTHCISGTTMNDIFNNNGFVFYFGTRAENKYADLTEIEINKLNSDYNYQIKNTTNLYTNNYFILNGEPYTGYFNYYNGLPYTQRRYIEGQSQRLLYNQKYLDLINNAFGVRILDDGRIGYRNIYKTDPCYVGPTQDPNLINNGSFIDFTRDCDNFTLRKIITKYFTIEESYTKLPVLNVNDNKFLKVSVIFERDFTYNTDCELKYGEYKNGSLSILLNGFTVYKNYNFTEIIPHKLDTEDILQEGVPFNISFGGGTQGLYDAVYLDNNKVLNTIIDKFFAGTFYGGVRFIEMYSIPLYATEIRSDIINKHSNYNLFLPKGGRRYAIKNLI